MKEELEKAIRTLDNYCNYTNCEECEIRKTIGCKAEETKQNVCCVPYLWD